MDNKKISFIFHPFEYEQNHHIVEKSEEGIKRRYLKGITSGVAVDGHGEKITQKCIESFHRQANAGDVLLYADKHGVNYSDDIGILTKSEILPNQDWLTEYRLYDSLDSIGPTTTEKTDKIWKQMKGLPPYRYPRQKGFSIEGFIPDDGIVAMDASGKRVIDQIHLDGVVLVPRPAYQTSIAQSIYKALDEKSPWNVEKRLSSKFIWRAQIEDIENSYFRRRFQFQDLLEMEIENIMTDPEIGDKEETLSGLFTEYKDAMLELIVNSASLFDSRKETTSESALPEDVTNLYKSESYINNHFGSTPKIQVIKSLLTEVDKLILKLQ